MRTDCWTRPLGIESETESLWKNRLQIGYLISEVKIHYKFGFVLYGNRLWSEARRAGQIKTDVKNRHERRRFDGIIVWLPMHFEKESTVNQRKVKFFIWLASDSCFLYNFAISVGVLFYFVFTTKENEKVESEQNGRVGRISLEIQQVTDPTPAPPLEGRG